LKGRVDAGRRFHQVGEEVAAATTHDDLMAVLKKRLRETLDASLVRLELSGDDEGAIEFCAMLEEIGEPVRDSDLHRLRDQHQNVRRGWFGRKRTATVPAVVADALFGQFDKDDYDVYVPLFRDRRCIGYLGLGVKIYGVPYSSEELGRLTSLSTQIGAALQNIRLLAENVGRKLLEEELNIARKIQSQLLPGDPPSLPGFELYAATVPSRHVGGDYYDFVVIEERWLVIVVADVSGKGIPASILTATLQATVRSNEDAQTDPETMMERLNRLLFKNTSSAEFATLFYTVVDLESGAMRYTNAGHEFPFLVNGTSSGQLTESGIVLGCLEDFHYEENTCQIPPNGSLVIYTDGVTDAETTAGEYYGTDRLQTTLQDNVGEGARTLCRIVIEDVRQFATGENQDDLTLVVLTRRE
jgi:sigma-B regulation protein RsbU (phosphoserine phosphatase)